MSDRRQRGFTFIEVLVVVAIMALVLVILMPAIQSARDEARKVQCKDRMKQIGLALENYHGIHSVFPYGSSCAFPTERRFTNVKHTWTEFLLPYLDEAPLYQHINFSESVDAGNNREVLEGILLPAYACPSNPFTGTFKTTEGVYFRDWAVDHWPIPYAPVQSFPISFRPIARLVRIVFVSQSPQQTVVRLDGGIRTWRRTLGCIVVV